MYGKFLGQRIAKIRRQQAIDASEFSKRLGIDKLSLDRFEAGTTPMPQDLVAKALEVLGIPSSKLDQEAKTISSEEAPLVMLETYRINPDLQQFRMDISRMLNAFTQIGDRGERDKVILMCELAAGTHDP